MVSKLTLGRVFWLTVHLLLAMKMLKYWRKNKSCGKLLRLYIELLHSCSGMRSRCYDWAFVFMFVHEKLEFFRMWSYLRSPPFMIVMTRQSSSFVWKAYASDTMKRLWTFSRILFSTIAPYRRKLGKTHLKNDAWSRKLEQNDFSFYVLKTNMQYVMLFVAFGG